MYRLDFRQIPVTDAELVTLWQKGNYAGWIGIHDKYYDDIHRYITSQTKDPVISEDITMDVFLRLNRMIEKFEPERGTFKNWFFTMASNFTKSAMRKHLRYRMENIEYLDKVNSSNDEKYDGVNEALYRAIENLTPEKQHAVIGILGDKSLEDIAAEAEVPVGTIKSRLYYARQDLSRDTKLRQAYLGV